MSTTLNTQSPDNLTSLNLATNAPSSEALAKYIDLAKWDHNNDNEYHWQGQIALQDLPRLYALRDETHRNNEPLNITLTIKKTGVIIMWHLKTAGTLWQTCQRCLEPVAIDLDTDSEIALLESEAHVALLDEDIETILLSELTNDNKLWLLPMIEDELLVDLPLSPKHADCHMAVTQVGELPEVVEEQENPFAMLASLKGNLS